MMVGEAIMSITDFAVGTRLQDHNICEAANVDLDERVGRQ
jgi:hypothetical protein